MLNVVPFSHRMFDPFLCPHVVCEGPWCYSFILHQILFRSIFFLSFPDGIPIFFRCTVLFHLLYVTLFVFAVVLFTQPPLEDGASLPLRAVVHGGGKCAWWGTAGETKSAELPLRHQILPSSWLIRLFAFQALEAQIQGGTFTSPYSFILSRTGLSRDLSYSQQLCLFWLFLCLFSLNLTGEVQEHYTEEAEWRMAWKE